jgi:type VI secretion system protein VasD
MILKKFIAMASIVGLANGLSGCSILTNTIARSASDIATQNMMRVVKEVEGDKTIHVTVVGHAQLNPSRDGTPRPLAYCSYLVRAADWRPLLLESDAGQCMSKEQDAAIVDVSRSIIAPNQIQHQQFKLQGTYDLWLVMTADSGGGMGDRSLYRQMLSGRGWIHSAVWATGTGFYAGLQPLPSEALLVRAAPVAVTRAPDGDSRAAPKPSAKDKAAAPKPLNNRRTAQSIAVPLVNSPVSSVDSEPIMLNLTTRQ